MDNGRTTRQNPGEPQGRQGRAVLGSIMILFLAFIVIAWSAEMPSDRQVIDKLVNEQKFEAAAKEAAKTEKKAAKKAEPVAKPVKQAAKAVKTPEPVKESAEAAEPEPETEPVKKSAWRGFRLRKKSKEEDE